MAELYVKATVQRHVTDEETVCFEGTYPRTDEALDAVSGQLALVRAHMAKYNEEVHLVSQKKAAELDAALAAKGEELAAAERKLADVREQLAKGEKRLKAAS